MPRIRTVKPEFWAHEELSEFPPETHMLAAALLNYADDEGYFNANPKLVKAVCCPLRDDSMSIQGSIKQLAQIGYIDLATGVDGKRYGLVRKFKDHQVISRPKESKIKDLIKEWDSSMNNHGSINDESSEERKGKEQGKEVEQGTGNREQADKLPTPAEQAIEYLNSVSGAKYQKKGKSLGHANARIDDGHTLDDLKLVVDAKWAEWRNDAKMAQYLRPETLFGASKFPGYLVAAKAKGGSAHTGFDNREYTDHIPDWENDDD